MYTRHVKPAARDPHASRLASLIGLRNFSKQSLNPAQRSCFINRHVRPGRGVESFFQTVERDVTILCFLGACMSSNKSLYHVGGQRRACLTLNMKAQRLFKVRTAVYQSTRPNIDKQRIITCQRDNHCRRAQTHTRNAVHVKFTVSETANNAVVG
jgi:hypothetical protein